MDSGRSKQSVSEAVREVLWEIFGEHQIGEIRVSFSHDDDGDDVIVVDVEFKGTEDEMEGRKVASVIGMIRDRLSGFNEHAFPIISYLSSDEIGARNEAVG